MWVKRTLALFFIFSLFVGGLFIDAFTTKAQDMALYRGYRTGYSDGYMAGYRDATENAARDYSSHEDYKNADRGYRSDFGSLEDYKDGYRQGFEKGYGDGYEKRNFNSEVPTNLKRRQQADTESKESTEQNTNTRAYENNSVIVIPAETELIIELQDEISTATNKEGDKFKAKVVSPRELNGATIEGRVSKIQKPARLIRRAEMLLSFDIIRLDNNRWANYNAMVVEVFPVKGDNVKQVDNEGSVQGKSSVKEDATRIGVTAGSGAVIGGVIGGPVGVAVGAGVGAAFGVGTIFVERGKHIKLVRGQQLRIKTAYETRIR